MNYNVGDVIHYMAFGGTIRRVRVTAKDPVVKNGQPGFDGDHLDDNGNIVGRVWGYDDQIIRKAR
jgi:hypothetical protein